MAGSRILHRNGKDIPDELRELPAGKYIIEAVDNAPALAQDEEKGIANALASLRAGQGRTIEQVRTRIESLLSRR